MKDTLKKIKHYLGMFMIVMAGSFVGRALHIYTRFKKDPWHYEITGKSWVMDVVDEALFAGLVIAITAIAFLIVSYKLKKEEKKEDKEEKVEE